MLYPRSDKAGELWTKNVLLYESQGPVLSTFKGKEENIVFSYTYLSQLSFL